MRRGPVIWSLGHGFGDSNFGGSCMEGAFELVETEVEMPLAVFAHRCRRACGP